MPQLDLSTFPSQLFWLFLSFSLLYIMLSRFILPQVAEVLEHRKHRIDTDLERAASLKSEAEQVKHVVETALQAARVKANEVQQTTAARIAAMQEERLHKLEESLAHQLQEAEQRIRAAREKMEAELRPVIEQVVADVVQHVAGIKTSSDVVKSSLKQASK